MREIVSLRQGPRMAIDKPREVLRNIYYPDKENKSPLELVILGTKLALPKAAMPLELFSEHLQQTHRHFYWRTNDGDMEVSRQ